MTLASVATMVMGLSGCTDLTPIQNQVKDLSSQVSRLSSDQAAMRSTLESTGKSARDAESAASRAGSKADQALALAQANQGAISATNEKIERMFRRHLSK
jgi:outer membrane murein-binding lipoprotein Lpp